MLRSLYDITKCRIHATDGRLGGVEDFYFDDWEWFVRYLVVDTGNWLPGRRVLISPASILRADHSLQQVDLSLSKDDIESSPDVATDEPVSRRKEASLAGHYNWPIYWGGGAATPALAPAPATATEEAHEEAEESQQGDPRLRSVREVKGYAIAATDGSIGHVEDFIAGDDDWAIRYMVVDTRKWLPGRKVLIAPWMIRSVEWKNLQVHVDLSRDQVQGSPEFDPAAPVNREYEARLYDYYGRPKYWL